MHFKWNCDWNEIHVGRSSFPRKRNPTVIRKKSLPWLSLASGLEKYLKHASQILLSYGKKMCTPMKMAYIQVGPCRQWFMVCIVPACELVILVKEVESCLWRQDFPGTQETGSAGSWGLSPPSSTAPIPGPVHHWNTNSRWDFICWNVFKTAGFWSFKSLVSTRSKDYLANYGCVQKCSHPQSDLSLFSLWCFSLKIWILSEGIIFISNLKSQPWREAVHCWRIWSQPAKFCYKFTQNPFSYRLLSWSVLLIHCMDCHYSSTAKVSQVKFSMIRQACPTRSLCATCSRVQLAMLLASLALHHCGGGSSLPGGPISLQNTGKAQWSADSSSDTCRTCSDTLKPACIAHGMCSCGLLSKTQWLRVLIFQFA